MEYMARRTNHKFRPEEDMKLRRLVSKYGELAWNEIAAEMDERNARQCHDRWTYYLSPALNCSPWTQEEDKRLIRLAKQYKGKWVAISKHFNRRTDTQIKNRWNILKKKMNLPELPRRRHNKPYLKFTGIIPKCQQSSDEEKETKQIVSTTRQDAAPCSLSSAAEDSSFETIYKELSNIFDSFDFFDIGCLNLKVSENQVRELKHNDLYNEHKVRELKHKT